jgi:hypothetical protein
VVASHLSRPTRNMGDSATLAGRRDFAGKLDFREVSHFVEGARRRWATSPTRTAHEPVSGQAENVAKLIGRAQGIRATAR